MLTVPLYEQNSIECLNGILVSRLSTDMAVVVQKFNEYTLNSVYIALHVKCLLRRYYVDRNVVIRAWLIGHRILSYRRLFVTITYRNTMNQEWLYLCKSMSAGGYYSKSNSNLIEQTPNQQTSRYAHHSRVYSTEKLRTTYTLQ